MSHVSPRVINAERREGKRDGRAYQKPRQWGHHAASWSSERANDSATTKYLRCGKMTGLVR